MTACVALHGGGWDRGAKGGKGAWKAQLDHWLPEGAVFVPVQTRLGPEADPADQAADLVRAIAAAREAAAPFGGAPERTILLGFSSGGQVAALAAADPDLRPDPPLAGVIVLDAAYLDVERFMARPQAPVFRRAFGTDPGGWARLSPLARLGAGAPPFLLICGTHHRPTCADNARFAAKAAALGVPATVVPSPLSHGDILRRIGEPSEHTDLVMGWIDGVLEGAEPSDAAPAGR